MSETKMSDIPPLMQSRGAEMAETIKHEVKNRWSGDVQFTAEIECAPTELPRVKLGLAVRWAVKSGAYLGGADLGGADLSGAYLGGADLGGANLSGADLSGAKSSRGELVGAAPILMLGPIGSEGRIIIAESYADGVYVKAGCFFGDLNALREAAKETHGDNEHALNYLAICDFLQGWGERQRAPATTRQQ